MRETASGRRQAPRNVTSSLDAARELGIVGWPGTSDHVGPVAFIGPRPCDAQDRGGGRSEHALRGDRRNADRAPFSVSAAQ